MVDFQRYVPGAPRDDGWGAVHGAIQNILALRQAKEAQAAAQAHAEEMQRQSFAHSEMLQRQTLGAQQQAAAAEREQQMGDKAAELGSSAVLAEAEGDPAKAAAALAHGQRYGLRSEYEGREGVLDSVGQPQAPQLSMPHFGVRKPPVDPSNALAYQLQPPKTLSDVPPAGSINGAIARRLAEEQGRLSPGDQGREIGAMGRDINAIALGSAQRNALPSAISDVMLLKRGNETLGRVDRDADRAQRMRQARAVTAGIPASVAGFGSTLESGAADTVDAAVQGSADAPVKAVTEGATANINRLTGLARAQTAAEAANARSSNVSDRQRDQLFFRTQVTNFNKEKLPEARDAANKLVLSLREARAGNPVAMGGLPIQMARLIQGSGQVSNADADSFKGTAFYNYIQQVQDWMERKVSSDPTWSPDRDNGADAPPVSVEFMTAYADDILRFKDQQLARMFEADLKQTEQMPYSDPVLQQGAREQLRRVYAGIVSPEALDAIQQNDAKFAAGNPGRNTSASVSRSASGPNAPQEIEGAPDLDGALRDLLDELGEE